MRRLVLAGLLLMAVGCGSDSDPMDPGDGGNPGNLPAGTVTARIDGSTWTSTAPVAVAYAGGILAVGASNTQLVTIGFAVAASAPGTYTIGPTSPTNALLTIGTANSQTWHASSAAQGSSGSITITSLSATGATGTFQFTMVPDGLSGSTGTKTITNGAFNLTF